LPPDHSNPPRRGPIPRPLGALLAPLYRFEMSRRNRRYDQGKGVITFDRPVISVGNLSVGGTGKTPMVAHLVRTLLGAGHHPVIAMRGYGGGGGGEGGGAVSDEAEEYRARFPDLPIVAQPDRARGLIILFGEQHDTGGPHSDCIILDDGFQHRKIARQMDIVLIDATRSPFDDRLLPAGWLREPVASLRRATHTIITHAESATAPQLQALQSRIKQAHGRAPAAVSRHAWEGLSVYDAAGGEARAEPVAALRGKKLIAVCGIGNPAPFLAAAQRAAGGALAEQIVLPDHARYARPTLERIRLAARATGAGFIITTAKDWSKLSTQQLPCPVVVPRLTLAFDAGEAEFTRDLLELVARGVPDGED
jgi:tetraacyldisaccharide 4'-kinase